MTQIIGTFYSDSYWVGLCNGNTFIVEKRVYWSHGSKHAFNLVISV